MREAETEADGSVTPVRCDLSVEAFLNKWLDDELPGTVFVVTEAQYRQVVNLYIVPRLGRKKLRTRTASDVSSMLRDMTKPNADRLNGYSHTARRLARGVLRARSDMPNRKGSCSATWPVSPPGQAADQGPDHVARRGREVHRGHPQRPARGGARRRTWLRAARQ